jgi:hypothetical protein
MKLKQTIPMAVLAMITATALTRAETPAKAFIRPSVAYIIPESDGYDDNKISIGLTAGAASDINELSAEVGFFGWDFSEVDGVVSIKAKESYLPILANYRRYFSFNSNQMRLYVGPSMGFTPSKYEIEGRAPGVFVEDDATKTRFTLAANVGFDIKVNERISFNLGYRYLYLNKSTIEILDTDVDLDALKAHVVNAGLNIRF